MDNNKSQQSGQNNCKLQPPMTEIKINNNNHALIATKKITFTALFTAVICVLSPLSINIGLVPISLATFAIYLAGALAGRKMGTVSVAVYILLGIVGIPVFANFTSGFAKILGITGGYILGYLPMVYFEGLIIDKFGKRKSVYPFAMLIGTLFCYGLGTVWYSVVSGVTILNATKVCIIPFLIGDLIKIISVCVLVIPVKNIFLKYMLKN